MKIYCSYKELVPLHKIIPNPKNTNKHPVKQIDLLAKIIDFQGIRHPIIVSTLSGFIVAGHGRLEAAKKLGFEKFPVDYQDFDTPAQEYTFLESDNHVAELAEHDRNLMIENLKDFPEINLELIAIPGLESLKNTIISDPLREWNDSDISDIKMIENEREKSFARCIFYFKSEKDYMNFQSFLGVKVHIGNGPHGTNWWEGPGK